MIIFKYISKEVALTLLAVIGVLELIFLSDQFVRYLSDAASGQLAVNMLFELLGLQVPYLIGVLFPLALFLGVLLVFSRLYGESEMHVLIASGISRLQLLFLTMGVAIPAIAAAALLTLWLNPVITKAQEKILAADGSKLSVQTALPGRFQAVDSGSKVFYAQGMSRDHQHMENVFIAEQEVDKKTKKSYWNIWLAKGGNQEERFNALYYVLNDGYRYSGMPGAKNFEITHYQQYGLRLKKPSIEIATKLQTMSTAELFAGSNKNPAMAAELQWRISVPLSMLILVILAVPLSRVQPRVGKFAQFLPAILLYIIYVNLLMVAKSWVADGAIPAIIGMWWVHLLAIVIAIVVWKNKLKFFSQK